MSEPPRTEPDETRKRSRIVLLTLMGVGAGAVLAAELWPSGDGVPAGVFQNVESCVGSGRYDAATCHAAFDEVAHHHVEHAPRYASQADCEADFTPGGCAPLDAPPGSADAGAARFAPVVAGVLIGGALAAGSSAPPAIQPVYRSCTADPQDRCQTGPSGGAGGGHWYGGGGLYTCSGYRVGSSYGATRVEPAAFTTVRSATLSRGGFGTRARFMSIGS
jgi:uncharacterized protein YgiB involved in biofilm formation